MFRPLMAGGRENGQGAMYGALVVVGAQGLVAGDGLFGGSLIAALAGDPECCDARDSGLVRYLARFFEYEATVGCDFRGDLCGHAVDKRRIHAKWAVAATVTESGTGRWRDMLRHGTATRRSALVGDKRSALSGIAGH